jgi:hypothetical protein
VPVGSVTNFPEGGQVDFQVRAMIGYITVTQSGIMGDWVEFHGETSEWSSTETITILTSTSSPEPTPTSTPTPTAAPEAISQPATLPATLLFIASIGIALGVIGLFVYFKKRK